jgi:hypothetical protein
MKYKIDSPVIQNNIDHKEVIYVMPSSDDVLQSALEVLAEYFKKEFRYDYLQYCKHDENSDCTGFLLTERALDLVEDIYHHPYRIVGGGCFRSRDSNSSYFLDWVWLHPFARNRGRLKKVWPQFKENFGSFTVTKPLSAQMKAFLEKYA